MALRTDITVDPSVSPRLIVVASPSVEITVQEILDFVQWWEAEPANCKYPPLIDRLRSGGKQTLRPGRFVGLTYTLSNTLLKFEARGSQTTCFITDGNLTAVDTNGDPVRPPWDPSTNVNVSMEADTSPALIETDGSGLTQDESDALLNIEADIATLNASVSAINGNIATIQTDIGFIQTDITLIHKVLRNKKVTFKSGPNAGWMFIYDDPPNDNVVFLKCRIYEDDQASVPYRGTGLERSERLVDGP